VWPSSIGAVCGSFLAKASHYIDAIFNMGVTSNPDSSAQ
jgi:hypothetical protein